MRYFGIIIIALTLLSCSNTGADQDPVYPLQIGTWQVNSETDSDWIGTESSRQKVLSVQTRAEGDTIDVYSPDSLAISIRGVDEPHMNMELIYIDSTLKNPDFEMWDTDVILPQMAEGGDQAFSGSDTRIETNADRYKATLGFSYQCRAELLPEDETILIRISDDEGKLLKLLRFYSEGLKEVVHHNVCGDPI